jgi:hypothetical protein
LKQFLAFGQPLAGRQQEVCVSVVSEPSMGIRLNPGARLQKAAVRVHDVAGARPAA